MVIRSRQRLRRLRRRAGLRSGTAALPSSSGGFVLSAIAWPVRGGQVLLKLLWCAADNPVVHKSAIVIGLTLAMSVTTLAGIGEWAAEESGDSAADPASPSLSLATLGVSAGNATVALAPMPADLLPAASYSPASAPGYTISRTVPEVRLAFTVVDEQGRLVRDLSAQDIRILDNQSPVEHFNDFARDENLPLRLGIVLDTSDSVKRVLPDEKIAALNFLNRIMRSQNDRAFVMAFGGDIHIWQTSTANRAQLIDAVGRMYQPGWATRLYDALYSACNEYLSHPDDSNLVHRAIVVLSDGEDTNSSLELRNVVAIALRSEVQIYALTLHSKKQVSRGDTVLQRLAEQTGGRFFVAQSNHDLESMFAEIEQDLRTQYYVSFPPQQVTPGFHTLQVEVRGPQKMQVHARQGYYAPTQ